MGCKLGVTHRVLNVTVAEIMLNGAGINAFIREVKPTSMSQHMGMDRERELRFRSGSKNHVANGAIAERTTSFRHKDIGQPRIDMSQLSQSPQLRAMQRMSRRDAMFEPTHMQQRRLQIDGLPP